MNTKYYTLLHRLQELLNIPLFTHARKTVFFIHYYVWSYTNTQTPVFFQHRFCHDFNLSKDVSIRSMYSQLCTMLGLPSSSSRLTILETAENFVFTTAYTPPATTMHALKQDVFMGHTTFLHEEKIEFLSSVHPSTSLSHVEFQHNIIQNTRSTS